MKLLITKFIPVVCIALMCGLFTTELARAYGTGGAAVGLMVSLVMGLVAGRLTRE